MSGRRTALVHDYLNQRGGAERVLGQLARAYPEAPVYTALFDRAAVGDLVAAERVHSSWLQQVPFSNRVFRYLAPLYPAVFESFDFTGFDLVISSTSSFAKGIIVPATTTHVCFIHTVSRFVFDYDAYVGGLGASTLGRPIVARLAQWDRRAATRPTAYIANSHNVARRVKEHYGRDSHVLHSPVDVGRFTVGSGRGNYFLVVSRLLPYKRVDLAIEACALAGVRLIVAGAGPAEAALKERARGTRTEFTGFVSDADVARLMADATALILPGEEDLGMVPIEANAAGRPAIAFGGGGALETVQPGVTGEHFSEQTAGSLAAVLRTFDACRYDPAALAAYAQTYAPERFIERFGALVEAIVSKNAPS